MIEMCHVTKAYGQQTVLQDVCFDVGQGEIFGLLGPSGAGKTTIINILTGQVDADSGDHSLGVTPAETGLMLDENGLYRRLTARENLDVFARIYGIPRGQVAEALRDVGLADAADKPVSALSTGMRQRLALARALMHRPKVLFLDEPTSGLDPVAARGIHQLIRAQQDAGATVFLTTHNMDEAVELCSDVALLHRGRIVERGTPQDICERHHAVKTVPDLGAVFIELTGVGLE